ncbi:hypothetical protein [Reyranella sp.]|uniref:hypothetical protein n=1 Tax=Reyranella sp. TaxID=1929291 RepID=UPI003BA8E7E6
MYQPRKRGYRKDNATLRWSLPDRVFFACGACHILAYAFLERWGTPGMQALWIRPAAGQTGNHVFVDGGDWVFDYHGYANRPQFLAHVWRGARRRWPGWDATLVPLPRDVLISEQKSRGYDGLWLREPGQFLHDAMPRANAYLDRFRAPAVRTAR